MQILNSKVDEKTKLLNEAKKAYNKIKENTTKLIEAIDNENEEYSETIFLNLKIDYWD